MLSFSAVKEHLHLRRGFQGHVWWHEPHGRLHRWHHHEDAEFNLVVRGTARYLVKDRRCDLRAGDLVFLFAKQEHLLVDLSDDFACWIAVARPGPLRRSTRDSLFTDLHHGDPPLANVRHLSNDDARVLGGFCHEAAAQTRCESANPLILATFIAAWSAFQRAPAHRTPSLHPAVERALALLAADPEAALTAIARQAGLSLSRLSRLFHAEVGETLVSHRVRQRLERFQRLREAHGDRTLLALALSAGFGSYAQFHRAVRRFTGVSPQAWTLGGFVPT